MLQALTRRMSDTLPSDDIPVERRSGFVDFGSVVDAIALAVGPIREQIGLLREDLRRETRQQTKQLAERLERHEAEAHARDDRIAILERWRDEQEIADAVHEGRVAIVLLTLRWFTQHWQFMWAVVALILGLTWAATGAGPVAIGPVEAPVSSPLP